VATLALRDTRKDETPLNQTSEAMRMKTTLGSVLETMIHIVLHEFRNCHIILKCSMTLHTDAPYGFASRVRSREVRVRFMPVLTQNCQRPGQKSQSLDQYLVGKITIQCTRNSVDRQFSVWDEVNDRRSEWLEGVVS